MANPRPVRLPRSGDADNIGFGKERRLKINEDILNLKVGFRDGFKEMIDSVSPTLALQLAGLHRAPVRPCDRRADR